MPLTTKDLALIKVTTVAHQTITWALSQKEGMTKTVVVQIMVLREGHSEVARSGVMVGTTGACLIDEDLTQIFMMTLIDQMIFIQISDLATGCVNLRGEEAHCYKTRNGDEVAQDLPFPLITGTLKEGAQIVGLLGLGKDGDPLMRDIRENLTMQDSGEDGMKVSEEEHPQDMRGGDPGEGIVFLGQKTLGQKTILTHQMRTQEEEIMVVGGEVEVLREEAERVYFPLQMSFPDLKEEGNQNPGMETENQVPVRITLLMMDSLLPAESVLLHFRVWTWPHCHHANVPGTMDQVHLITEKWKLQVHLQRREAKDEEAQDRHRECQSLGGLALWRETIMMDSTEMKVLAVLQEAITLPEEGGVEVIGEEAVT